MKPIIKATLKIKNDEDKGPCSGSWALDDLVVNLTVYRSKCPFTPSSSSAADIFTANVSGTWKTFKGARSPEREANKEHVPERCVIQQCCGFGVVVGFLTGLVKNIPKSKISKKTQKVTYDLGGTKKNILLPREQQAPSKNVLDAIKCFLETDMVRITDFAADYWLRDKIVWTNRPEGNTGDVVISCSSSSSRNCNLSK